MKYVGLFFCVFGAIAGPAFYFLTSRMKPASLSEEGLISPAYCGDYLVRWSEVTKIRSQTVRCHQFICLDIKPDVPTTLSSQISKSFGYGGISLSTAGTGFAYADVRALIEALVKKATIGK